MVIQKLHFDDAKDSIALQYDPKYMIYRRYHFLFLILHNRMPLLSASIAPWWKLLDFCSIEPIALAFYCRTN